MHPCRFGLAAQVEAGAVFGLVCYCGPMGLKSKPSDSRERAKRAALHALKRARRAAERSGVSLSEWEGEFLGSVESRVEQYGRAFRDPEKGAAGASLSLRQNVKLKEIAGKASGKIKVPNWRKRRTAKQAPP